MSVGLEQCCQGGPGTEETGDTVGMVYAGHPVAPVYRCHNSVH